MKIFNNMEPGKQSINLTTHTRPQPEVSVSEFFARKSTVLVLVDYSEVVREVLFALEGAHLCNTVEDQNKFV